jgi:hypothetical protein
VPGCIAVSLDIIRVRVVQRRDFLAEKHRLPPDPAVVGASRFDYVMHQHRQFLALSAAAEEIDAALARGDDIERTAVLGYYNLDPLAGFSARPIFSGAFVWAECSACGQRYLAEECQLSDWGWMAAPLFGASGEHVACPHGHIVFTCQTSVS